MRQEQVLQPAVVVRGEVPSDMIDYARTKVLAMVEASAVPVLEIDLRLTRYADPARDRPNHVEITVDLDGKLVRAHRSAPTMPEAIDAALQRLRRRIEALTERPQSRQLRHRDRESWHHEDRGNRRVPLPSPLEAREVVRRKTFALRPESIEEALFDLEVLDHDFFLFVHDETGTEAVVYRIASDGYGIMSRVPAPAATARVEIPFEMGPQPATHSIDDALAILDASGRSFEFFVDTDTRRGLVAYRREDGNYGLILPD